MTVSSRSGSSPAKRADRVRKDDRTFTEGQARHIRMMGDGLGDDVDRIRVVEDARLWRDRLHVGDDGFHRVDRAQRHEEAAGPCVSWPITPMPDGDTLVEIACLEAAGPITGQHRVAVGQSRPAVSRCGDPEVEAAIARHLAGDLADNLQTARIDIERTISEPLKFSPCSSNEATVPGARVLPPPI